MLLLLASLLCGVRPAAVQDVPSPEARRAEIVRLVVEHGAGRFETGLGGVAEEKPEDWLLLNSNGSPSYAEGSLEYAAALLMSGGDAARAAKIIDTVLAAQAAGGKVPGGFPWGPGAEPDAYATAYLAPWLAYIHQHLAGGLSEATRADVARALRPALGAAQRLNTRPADGLPFLTRTAAQASLGAALQDAGAGAKAAVDLAAWLRHVSAAGLPGAHRPSLATGIAAMLHWTWLFAPTPQAKADATAALEYLYRDLALRCQPEAGVVAGAVLDGRAADYALGTGPTRYLLYASFGRPS